MSSSQFTLREIQPGDSAAVASLVAEPDGMLTTHFLHDPFTTITQGNEFRTIGVVAEHPNYDGIVGMGTMRRGFTHFNGQRLPFAMLDSLKVRREFRGQGLGRLLAEWRVARARDEWGDDGVIMTGMLRDNRASRAVARHWYREVIEPFPVVMVPVRTQAPHLLPGLTVREAQAEEYDEIAARQNAFYQEYNGYDPINGEQIARLASASPFGQPVYRFFVAVDAGGTPVAGARVWYRGLLKVDKLERLPLPLKVMNKAMRMLPRDGVLREISVQGLWHLPNHFGSAQYLWQWMRWLCRHDGTSLGIKFDQRDSTRKVVGLKPWHQPRIAIALALYGPALLDRSRLFYGLNRV